MASGKAWRAARVPPGRTTLSLDPKGCLGEVSTHATGAETRLAATRSHEGTPRPGLGRGNRLTLGPDSEAESSNPSKKGRDTRCQQISDSPPKIRPQYKLQQPRKLRRTSLQHPAVKTYFHELTLLDVSKFSNPSTTFDRVALIPTQHGIQRTTARDAPSGPPRPLSSPRASPGSPGSVPALLADGLP